MNLKISLEKQGAISDPCLIIALLVHEAVLQLFALLGYPVVLQALVFILNPSLGQNQFHITLLFLSDYSHIHSSAVFGSLGTQILLQNSEDQGCGARAEDRLPLSSVTGEFF